MELNGEELSELPPSECECYILPLNDRANYQCDLTNVRPVMILAGHWLSLDGRVQKFRGDTSQLSCLAVQICDHSRIHINLPCSCTCMFKQEKQSYSYPVFIGYVLEKN